MHASHGWLSHRPAAHVSHDLFAISIATHRGVEPRVGGYLVAANHHCQSLPGFIDLGSDHQVAVFGRKHAVQSGVGQIVTRLLRESPCRRSTYKPARRSRELTPCSRRAPCRCAARVRFSRVRRVRRKWPRLRGCRCTCRRWEYAAAAALHRVRQLAPLRRCELRRSARNQVASSQGRYVRMPKRSSTQAAD